MSDQNWIITLKKQDCLDETQVLTSQALLVEALIDLLKKYPSYTEQDSITMQPTSMKCHV